MRIATNITVLCAVLALSATIRVNAQSSDEDLSSVIHYVKISDQIASSGQIPYEQMNLLSEEGYEVVINLAPVNQEWNAMEGMLVGEQGITYMNIPVSWAEPAMRDLELFFDMMEANRDRKIYVHCAANMRASVFVYLYRTLIRGEDESLAKADMDAVWDPSRLPQWTALIENAQRQFADAH